MAQRKMYSVKRKTLYTNSDVCRFYKYCKSINKVIPRCNQYTYNGAFVCKQYSKIQNEIMNRYGSTK